MRHAVKLALPALLLLGLSVGPITAQGPPGERGPGDPLWVLWMLPNSPRDQTILDYWRRAERGELTAAQRIDLGTMLFDRGFPNDAVEIFSSVLDEDRDNYEAWFRIGLVKHREGDAWAARRAYRKCLKHRPGHGWGNFYLGLLEEQAGRPSRALEHYQRSFQHAPELADARFNPAVLYSRLQLGASLQHTERREFTAQLPMAFVDPVEVAAVQARIEATLLAPPGEAAATTTAHRPAPSSETPAPVEAPAISEAPAASETSGAAVDQPPANVPFGMRGLATPENRQPAAVPGGMGGGRVIATPTPPPG